MVVGEKQNKTKQKTRNERLMNDIFLQKRKR